MLPSFEQSCPAQSWVNEASHLVHPFCILYCRLHVNCARSCTAKMLSPSAQHRLSWQSLGPGASVVCVAPHLAACASPCVHAACRGGVELIRAALGEPQAHLRSLRVSSRVLSRKLLSCLSFSVWFASCSLCFYGFAGCLCSSSSSELSSICISCLVHPCLG
jgi:hypothetical protein